jgi:hypothetical protein
MRQHKNCYVVIKTFDETIEAYLDTCIEKNQVATYILILVSSDSLNNLNKSLAVRIKD